MSSISYSSDTRNPDDMFLNVQYRTVSDDKSHNYKIRIERTPLHYGGHRYWFICPYRGKRVTKLYKVTGVDKYASRHALNLSYASQSETAHDRALRKKSKILAKFDEHYDYPKRPKGMHEKTYIRLWHAYDNQEYVCTQHFMDTLKKWGLL